MIRNTCSSISEELLTGASSRCALLAGAWLLAFGWAGCDSAIVGGECRVGLAACDGVCVDLDSDPLNCGACDHACADGQWCSLGRCIEYGQGGPDGGMGEEDAGGRPVDAGPADAGAPDAGSPRDAGNPDAGPPPPDCDLGELLCDDRCVSALTDVNHCGDCGVVCGEGQYCAHGGCVDRCPEPYSMCGESCVPVFNDPGNCGGCGVTCPDGVCRHGRCYDPTAGHVVVIGHDFRATRPAMDTIAGNAIFLAPAYPPSVLVYAEYADTDAVLGTDEAIDRMAAETGRTLTRFEAPTSRDVRVLLAEADVFVVYHQALATDDDIARLADRWRYPLLRFLRRGGVVVVFDGASEHAGTNAVLRGTGLVVTEGWSVIDERRLTVRAPSDGLALGVPVTYRAASSTVCYTMGDDADVVVADVTDDCPVVLHSIVLP